MFTKKALEYLAKENLPASELPRLQSQFREENYKTLLTAKQIVARFSPDEVSAAHQLLHSDEVISVENYEFDAFSSELRENNRLILPKLSYIKGELKTSSAHVNRHTKSPARIFVCLCITLLTVITLTREFDESNLRRKR